MYTLLRLLYGRDHEHTETFNTWRKFLFKMINQQDHKVTVKVKHFTQFNDTQPCVINDAIV